MSAKQCRKRRGITWTKGDGTRTGNVVIHYVKDTGLEKDVTDETVQASDLTKYFNEPVDLTSSTSPWQKELKADDNGTTYVFDHVAIGSRDGQTITGVKIAQGTETKKVQTGYDDVNKVPTYTNVTVENYKLYYTTDENVSTTTNWVLYKDSASENTANNADIYMIYRSNTWPVTVHFLDMNNNVLRDSQGNEVTKTFDGGAISGNLDFVTWTLENAPEGYAIVTSGGTGKTGGINGSNQTTVRLNVASTGTTFRYLKYDKDSSDNKYYLYAGRVSGNSVSYSAPGKQTNNPLNVYITVQALETGTITFHHVDQYGAKLTDDSTISDNFNPITHRGSYTNQWEGFSNLYSQSWAKKNEVGSYLRTDYESFNSGIYSADEEGHRLGIFYNYNSSNGKWFTSAATSKNTADSGAITPHFISDYYSVYSGKKGVTIHYVDENGNDLQTSSGAALSSGDSFNAASKVIEVDGYSYKEARIDGINGAVFTDVVYAQQGNNWNSTVTNNGVSVDVSAQPVNDVYLIYTKNTSKATLTAHYIYDGAKNSDLTSSDFDGAYYRDGGTKKNTAALDINNTGEVQLIQYENDNYEYVFEDIVKDGQIKRAAKSGETGDANGDVSLTFRNVHVASEDGPTVTSVELSDDGSFIYHTDFDGSMTPNSTDHNWTYTEVEGTQKGRRFVLTVDNSGNPTLQDSTYGSINLNYATEPGGSSADGTQQLATYTATFHGDKETTEYTVYYTPASGNTTASYRIHVEDSFPSANTNLYYTYVDSDNNDPANGLSIENDILYSGLFRARLSDSLRSALNGATDIQYRWYQKKVPTDTQVTKATLVSSPGTEVTWKQTGQHQNTAQNLANRVFLDIEADEGTDTWTYGTDIYYYLTLTYTPKGSTTPVTISSEPEIVGYYGQLENGDFENTEAGSLEQQAYLTAGGVWKTTAPGALNTLKEDTDGKDIEIVDGTLIGRNQSLIQGYHWNGYVNGSTNRRWTGDSENVGEKEGWEAAGDASATSWAQHESKFAELNAENAGALYQDVITHPNEELSYHFAHRARGSKEADGRGWHFDRMYLVIMPTKLAMTAGDNETELRTQDELRKFINAHGGFDESMATGTEDEITYRDVENGILIRKVSSDESAWHTITSVNSYIAKGGLTRFFFVAASECSDAGRYAATGTARFAIPTEGNFLDNVGFSQTLPTPKGFSLVATKTFRGLTQTQIADLASTKTENGQITSNASPFTMTVTNQYSTNGNDTRTNDALSNAALHFTAVNTGTGTYNFSGTAEQFQHKKSDGSWEIISESDYQNHKTDTDNYRVVNLLDETDDNGNKKNSFTVRNNPDGSVTMTWTFTDQDLPSAGSSVYDTQYTVKESHGTVAGYTVEPEVSATVGQTWRQAATGIMDVNNNYQITGSTINGVEGLTTVDANTDYEPGYGVNFMVGQLSNGARTGYLVWTHSANNPEGNQSEKESIVNYINSLNWDNKVTADLNASYGQNGHVEFRHGDNDQKPFAYDQANPSLTITFTMGANNIPVVRFQNAVTEMGSSATRTMRESYVGRYIFTNTYTEKTAPQITVQKIFTGVTRSTVDDLLKGDSANGRNGYQITLTKTNTDQGTEIAGTKPSIVLNPQTSSAYSNVSYSAVTNTNNGEVILTWIIKELESDVFETNGDAQIGGPGTYSIKEENYHPEALSNGDENILQHVTVNGDTASIPEDSSEAISKNDIHVGIESSSPMINADATKVKQSSIITSGQAITDLAKGTNLIIAETNDGHYTVWTPETAGVNLRQAILKKINELWHTSGTKAVMSSISFRSGNNPGAMEYSNAHQDTIMDYNNSTGILTFTNGSSVNWTRYYAAVYTLKNGTDGSMTTNDTEIQIANCYDPVLRLKKVSNTLDGEALSGAKFRLYKKVDGKKLYYTSRSTHTQPVWEEVDVSNEQNTVGDRDTSTGTPASYKALSFTSGPDGTVTIGVVEREINGSENHQDTDYYLEEYDAPDGYNTVLIKFRINADETLAPVDKNGKLVEATDDAQVSWDGTYYLLTIRDTAGIRLPDTGGAGTYIFYIAGAILVITAGLLLIRKKKAGDPS